MSKYDPLWKWINKNKTGDFKLTYAEIENIVGVPIDHSFLTFKKELQQYGFRVAKISMKEQTVTFEKQERQNNMELVSDYMHDDTLRHALNELTRKTFCFDFESWVMGGWSDGRPFQISCKKYCLFRRIWNTRNDKSQENPVRMV